MGEIYKLRLGDGTVVAVDRDGLRTWLIDAKAMVQLPGSQRWRPLKQLLMEEPAATAWRPEPAPPKPAAGEAPSRETPTRAAPARPEAAPPPKAVPLADLPVIPLKPLDDEPVPIPLKALDDEPAPIPVKPLDQGRPQRVVLTSLADDVAPSPRPLSKPKPTPASKADDELPIIPFKRLDDDEPPFHVSADSEGETLVDVAKAEVERHGTDDRLWQWSAPEPRGASAPSAAAARPSGGPGASDDDEVLEEIDLVDEGTSVQSPRAFPSPPMGAAAPAVPLLLRNFSRWVDWLIALVQQFPWPRLMRQARELVRQGRQLASRIPGKPSPLSATEPVPRDAMPPPTPIAELPVLRLKPIEEDRVVESIDRPVVFRHAWAWAKRGLVVLGVVAVAFVVVSTRSAWLPMLFGPSGAAGKTATSLPPAPPRKPEPPPLPREVQVAIAQLPHLSPETIQLVISRGGDRGIPDPPEVFRRASVAANRGASALTEDEARQLRALEAAVLAALRPIEQDRVRAYDRMSPVRDLLVAEDSKVLALFTRGVRSLSPPRRERLQALLGKAIGAELAPRTPPAVPVP
jgi:hypothetical protein